MNTADAASHGLVTDGPYRWRGNPLYLSMAHREHDRLRGQQHPLRTEGRSI